MCDSGIDDFPAADDDVLGAGMARAAALGLPVAVHAERPSALREPAGTTLARLRRLAAGRGRAGGDRARARARRRDRLRAARRAREQRRRRRARRRGARARRRRHLRDLPALPHADRGRPRRRSARARSARRRCAPPRERDALWEHLAAGRIAFVASDHSPCPPEMKAGDFTAAWGGIAGCQSLLALLLDAQRLPLQTTAALTSANVASRLRAAQGPPRARRRRRPRARRPSATATRPSCTTAIA